jgi:hypothetical protein
MDDLSRQPSGSMSLGHAGQRDSLLDVLDRVLDKGVVIAGDIKINLLDIELLTIKIRLLIASADKAKEMGIDWWAHDPQLSSHARHRRDKLDGDKENRALRDRIERLEAQLKALAPPPEDAHDARRDQNEEPVRQRGRRA